MRIRQAPGWVSGAVRLARRHWLLTALLAAGLVLRVLTLLAYRPALIYIDSLKYLYSTGGADPAGYWGLLKPLLWIGNLGLVAAVQHVLGVAMAVTLYAVLLRRGTARWLAALACAPVLLDGYQLQMEQTVMPDVMFEALLVVGVAVLAWHARPRPWLVTAGGLILGASATVRQVGEVLIVPALAYVLVAAAGWGARLRQAGVVAVAFAVPILGYMTVSAALTGHFWLSYAGGDELYGRLVLATDCGHMQLPADERPLCPSQAAAARFGVDGLDHNPHSPLWVYKEGHAPPPGMTSSQVVSDFNRRLLDGDPAGVALAVGRSALTLFALDRDTSPGDTQVSRWQFQHAYPFYPETLYSSKVTLPVVARIGRQFGGGGPTVARPLASFLRAYQLGGGYTPGPSLALAALAGLAGSLALVRRRWSPDDRAKASACLAFFVSGAVVLLASDLFEFSWRYQLPALVTLPPAAALAVALGMGHPARRRLTAPSAAAREATQPAPAEPGAGHHDHAADRDQDRQGHPDGRVHHQRGADGGAHDDGRQHPEAPAESLRPATGY